MNTEVSCSASPLELKEITANTLEDISSSDLPSFISSDVAEDMILVAKQLFDQKKKRRYFNSGSQHDLFSTKTLIGSNYFYFYKNSVGEMQKTTMY